MTQTEQKPTAGLVLDKNYITSEEYNSIVREATKIQAGLDEEIKRKHIAQKLCYSEHTIRKSLSGIVAPHIIEFVLKRFKARKQTGLEHISESDKTNLEEPGKVLVYAENFERTLKIGKGNIKMRNGTFGALNPMPVMGNEAFVAFAKEWSQYLLAHKLDGKIIIPPIRYSRKDYIGIEFYAGKGTVICEGKGYVSNPYYRDDRSYKHFCPKDNYLSLKDNPDAIAFNVDVLPEFDISDNIMFERIHRPSKTDPKEIQDLSEKTRQMIYERSALVHRGLLGGYSI